MRGGYIGALIAAILLILHGIYLAPALIRHGSSAAFEWAIGLAVFFVFMIIYSLASLTDEPTKKK